VKARRVKELKPRSERSKLRSRAAAAWRRRIAARVVLPFVDAKLAGAQT